MPNNNVLYATYEELKMWRDRLKIESPLITQDLLDKAFLHKGVAACTFSPEIPEEDRRGQISFCVSSKEEYTELVKKFNANLKELGYTLESKV